MSDSAYGDVQSVANHLGVSTRTVRRMLARGLRHIKLDHAQQGRVIIAWTDLEAWLDAHAIERG
jgi:predicted site-specific integrase-resolvase